MKNREGLQKGDKATQKMFEICKIEFKGKGDNILKNH